MTYNICSKELLDLYNIHLNFNYKGKVIVDIGADIGTTAEFFLLNGAKSVWCVEGDPIAGEQCKKNMDKYFPGKSSTIIEMVTTPYSMERILSILGPSGDQKANLIKIDIEGWENVLLDIEDRIISEQKEFIIDYHSGLLGILLKEKLIKSGFKIIDDVNGEVIHAVKKENA